MKPYRSRKHNKYMVIEEYVSKGKESMRKLCEIMKVSRSGYYKWKGHEKTDEEKENEQIENWIRELDKKYGHILGYRQMCGTIYAEKKKLYGEKRIYGRMKKLGISSVIRRKRKKYRNAEVEVKAENLLKRDFNASQPNEKWLTDVTEFKTPSGRTLYLSGILDLYGMELISYEMSYHNDQHLAKVTLEKALKQNRTARPMLHTDRGAAYVSGSYGTLLEKKGIIHSMSRPNHCIDNGPMEGFWAILKTEMVGRENYTTDEELIKAIKSYIWKYNRKRVKKRYGWESPHAIRQTALKDKQNRIQYPIPRNRRIEQFREKCQRSTDLPARAAMQC